MKNFATSIPGVSVVECDLLEDARGSFCRTFCDTQLAGVLAGRTIRQINVSRTRAIGAIRGLHFQNPPHAEMKLVRCLRGRVWDVALDLRQGSPTFLRWHGEELSEKNSRMMVIPEGCAHGFQVLEPDSELLYLHTAPYMRAAEGGVRYDDTAIGITWPLTITDISERDRAHPLVEPAFKGIPA